MLTDDFMFRAILAAVTAAGVGMRICFQIRAARIGGAIVPQRDRTAFWVGATLLVPVMLGLLIAYLVDPAALPWSKLPLPRSVRWAGAGLSLVVIGLIAWVFASLGENLSRSAGYRTHARLVTTGPYRWVRHPLYSIAGLGWLGMGLMIASWPVLLGVLALPALLSLRAEREEAALVERFGDEYRAYMRRTGRFFPDLG
jgi:protein-S-isoprenylcysteine O-methyltransferase Ste14